MKPIRILQVFTVLNRGGAETNMMNYYRHMDRSRFQFDFLVHRFEEGAFEEEIKQMGGRIFRIRPLHPQTFNRYRREADDFFKQHDSYDIIHNHTSELGYFLLQKSQEYGVPIHIIHAHNSEMDRDFKSIFRMIWRRLLRKKAHHFFTCSFDASKWMLGEDRATEAWQMNNAIDTDAFRYCPAVRENLRQKENIVGRFNFVHTGRFNKQKNHLFLLEVFAEVVRLQPEARLYLVGDGDLRPQIEERIRQLNLMDHVNLLGVRSDVHELLQAMDYFIFPSLFEGLPVSLIEAQTSGIRCIISDGVPAEGILIDDNVQVLSLKNTAKEWAAQICLHLDYERKDVSEIIKEKGYDIHDNVRKLEEKYTELLANKKRM